MRNPILRWRVPSLPMMARAVPLMIATLASSGILHAARPMENLDRGVVAVRSSSSNVFVSWRLLGLDPEDTAFNLYRSTNGGAAVKLNGAALAGGTNYTDSTANLGASNAYHVRPVINGQELEASGAFTLPANHPVEPCVTIPLRSGPEIHFVWVGDLDGDGEYDYIVDRLSYGNTFRIEAYKSDGTFLWDLDYGPNSLNQNNIEGGSSVIDVGHWDGVTVYDLNNDGRAEVITKFSNGVRFGNGSTWSHSNNDRQWIGVLDGMTGELLNYSGVPQDHIAHGPMMAQMGVGWANGQNTIFVHMKNRQDNGAFNTLDCAYHWNGSGLSLDWKSTAGGAQGHQIRICDVNGDGDDDLCHIGYAVDGGNGARLYTVSGVVHGDRWHIGKFDPNRPGLQLWGVQQNNWSGMTEFYADAGNGNVIWEHYQGGGDIGRGDVGDIDPRHSGFEAWSFFGVYNLASNTQITGDHPYPVMRLWWDGDLLSESYNDGKIENWNYLNDNVERQVTTWHFNSATGSNRGAPMFYGDIMGDWREEVVMTSWDYSQLVVFTTDHPTNERIYTLPHNPTYRNSMTVKGYMQSHHVDYFLGAGMARPPVPDISYGNAVPPGIEGVKMLVNNASGRVMDVWNWDSENGGNIAIYDAWGGDSQRFTITDEGADLYSIRTVLSGNRALDVIDWHQGDGGNIGLWDYWGGAPQLFFFDEVESGSYRITPSHDPAVCIDAFGVANGDNVGTWSYWGGSNQHWSIEEP